MLEIKADTRNLEAAIAEFATLSRKSLRDTYLRTASTMVGQLIGITPPSHQETMGDFGGVTLAAKKYGESRAAADIAKLFPTSGRPQERVQGMIDRGFMWRNANGHRYQAFGTAYSLGEMAWIHRTSRNFKTGRTRIHGNMAVTTKALRRQYIASQIKNVGKLSAGWLNAARELKTPGRYTPAWITRHRGRPGGADISPAASSNVRIRIYNSNSWFGGGWDKRFRHVATRAETRLKSDIERELAKLVRKAERRQSRR